MAIDQQMVRFVLALRSTDVGESWLRMTLSWGGQYPNLVLLDKSFFLEELNQLTKYYVLLFNERRTKMFKTIKHASLILRIHD